MILLLCQIGGLGYVVLASAVALVAGRRLKVHESLAVAQTVDTSSVGHLRKSIRNIVLVTLSVELVGAALLYLATLGMPEVAWGHESPHLAAGAGNRVWWALFLSVSAFCNCGFVLSHGNLMAFAGSWPISLVVAALIFVGGIGFPVLEELARAVRARRAKIRPARLSLHTRVVLTASVVLVVAPAVMVFVLERRGALAHLAVWEQGLAALFQSVSMRTGGFNSVDIGAFGPAAMLLTSVVMFVGASPVSTAGGVRTTSVAAVYALVRSELRGESARLFDRELPSAVTRRATATIALGAAIWFSAASALLLQQGIEPMRAIFEIASAFATCGLSVGVTAQVNDLGKVVMIVTMVVGRVGPLTVVASLLTPKPPSRVQLIEERVLLG